MLDSNIKKAFNIAKAVQFHLKQAESSRKNLCGEKLIYKIAANLPSETDALGNRPLGSLEHIEPVKMTAPLTEPDKSGKSINESSDMSKITGVAPVENVSSMPLRSPNKPAVVPNTPLKVSKVPHHKIGYYRNTGIVDHNGDYVNVDDVSLLAKLGFEVIDYRGLEKTSEVLDVYSYVEKVAGVPKAVARAVDKGEAFSGEFLKDMDYKLPEGYEVKGDLVCPSEKTGASKLRSVVNITRADVTPEVRNYLANIGDKRIGHMIVSDDQIHGPTINYSWLDPKYRGMGLGKKMYGEVMRNQPKGILNSDRSMVSPAAQRIWDSFARNKNYNINQLVNAEGERAFIGQLKHLANKTLNKVATDQKMEHAVASLIKNALHKNQLIEKTSMLEKESSEKPGLWANIRAKKERGEKAAKPGDEAYPDKKQWDKLTKAAVAAWQRSEGKNPEGGLNAKGRASYKRETGGTLKAPVTESNPKGERAKRQNSFCSRMCGMKSKNTGSKAQGDPDSRINKSLRKWNCKCGEEHESLYEKVACLVKEAVVQPVSQAQANYSSKPTISPGNFKLQNNPINIPTQNLAQEKNWPSLKEMGLSAWNEGGDTGNNLVDNARSVGSVVSNTINGANLISNVTKGVNLLGKTVANFSPQASVGSDLLSANKRMHQAKPDIVGAGLDVAAAVGSGMMAYPPLAPAGAALSYGSMGTNALRDAYKTYRPGAPYVQNIQGEKIDIPSQNYSQPVNKTPRLPQPVEPTNIGTQNVNIKSKLGEATHELKSSNIKAVGYDKKEKELEVHFHSGGEYKYKDVPKSLFDRIKRVKSPGKFFHKHIKKDKPFEYEKIAAKLPKMKPNVSQQLLPGFSEWKKKQPFNHAEEAFRLGRISAEHRDKILSGRLAEETRPKFEAILAAINKIQPPQ